MIIGLGYLAKSGKDTIGAYLIAEHGFVKGSFAAKLKAACREIFGFSLEQTDGELKEVVDPYWGFTPRYAMQQLGDGFRHFISPDVWIRAFERSAPSGNVVITDVRYRNEAETIKRLGGKVYRVDRPGAGASNGIPGHGSETELATYNGWDGAIVNDGSLKQLYARAASLMGLPK